MTTAHRGLDRRSVGTGSLFFFVVGASAPMTVLAGGVVATYAATGVIGVPLSFLVLGVVLALFTIGYVAVGRHVEHPAPFLAYLARGLNPVLGLAGGVVALVAYNCIQISLYGLLGVSISGLIGGPWWLWAYVGLLVVALFGVLRIGINAGVLAILLTCEIAMILLFDLASFTHPAHGLDLHPLAPSGLIVNGVGGVLALGIAAFVGYESGPVYQEEARGRWSVTRASFVGLGFITVLYAMSSWAMAEAVGTETVGKGADAAPAVVAAARDPQGGLPFSVLGQHYGSFTSQAGQVLLITSIVAALLAFHNVVARYVFALARDKVLPARLGRVGRGARGGAPIPGSLVQSGIALVVVTVFLAAGADPFTQLFTWLSALAAVAVLVLMVATCFAVVGYFRRHPSAPETSWQRRTAPLLGAVALAVILTVTVGNLSTLLGTQPGSPLTVVLPLVVVLAALGGAAWGAILRTRRPDIYASIGAGEQKPLAMLSHAFADADL